MPAQLTSAELFEAADKEKNPAIAAVLRKQANAQKAKERAMIKRAIPMADGRGDLHIGDTLYRIAHTFLRGSDSTYISLDRPYSDPHRHVRYDADPALVQAAIAESTAQALPTLISRVEIAAISPDGFKFATRKGEIADIRANRIYGQERAKAYGDYGQERAKAYGDYYRTAAEALAVIVAGQEEWIKRLEFQLTRARYELEALRTLDPVTAQPPPVHEKVTA